MQGDQDLLVRVEWVRPWAEEMKRLLDLEKKLAELKSPGMAAAQQQAMAPKPEAKPAPVTPEPVKPEAKKPEVVAAAKPEPAKPEAAKPEVAKPEDKKPVEAAAPKPKPEAKPTPKKAAPPPEPDLVDQVLSALTDPAIERRTGQIAESIQRMTISSQLASAGRSARSPTALVSMTPTGSVARSLTHQDALVELLTREQGKALPEQEVEHLIRAFSLYFHLTNLAEEKHRVRRVRKRARAAGSPCTSATTDRTSTPRTPPMEPSTGSGASTNIPRAT